MARFTITLDDDIHQLLKEQAERDRRTLGQEIAYLLELYVPAYQKVKPGIASTPALHYPEGVRSAENPEGAPIITNNTSDDYDAYYNRPDPSTSQRRKTIIG